MALSNVVNGGNQRDTSVTLRRDMTDSESIKMLEMITRQNWPEPEIDLEI